MVPFTEKPPTANHRIGGQLKPAGGARAKVEQDIAFLQDRVRTMKQHPRPNTQLIEHYQTLLKSREAVLKWLLDGCDDETTFLPDRHPI